MILGLSVFAPRAAAVLLVDGRLLAASAEERFARTGGETAFPEQAIRFCLERARMFTGRTDVARVAIVDPHDDRPGRAPSPIAGLRGKVSGWTDKQTLRRRVRQATGVGSDQMLFVGPLKAHAANAFLTSPFDAASVLVVDGAGDEAVTAAGMGSGAAVDLESIARQRVDAGVFARIATDLSRQTGSTRLCLGGGLAGDEHLLARALRHSSVTEIHVPPAVDADGAALGAALHLWHAALGHPRAFVMDHAFWGNTMTAADAEAAASASGLTAVACDEPGLVARAAEILASGGVIGWAQEAAEWGPRALGHRSVLASVTHPAARARLRAVALACGDDARVMSLAVPAPFLGDIAEFDRAGDATVARFGALAMRLRPTEDGPLAPDVAAGGMLPVQAIQAETNPRLFALAERLGRDVGVPAVLQIPLHAPGESLANTEHDALRAFKSLDLDALVLDRMVVIA